MNYQIWKTRQESIEFIECNKNSLESIKIHIHEEFTENDLKVLFKSIEKLEKLKSFSYNNYTFAEFDSISFIHLLGVMAKKCKQFEEIDLFIGPTAEFAKNIFKAINEFKGLKSLTIRGIPYNITSEELKQLKSLQNLNFYDKLVIADQFFGSINEYLPKLRSIECENAEINITEQTFHSLSLLKSLQNIYFYFKSTSLPCDDSVITQFIKNSPTIKSIKFLLSDKSIEYDDEIIFKIKIGVEINPIIRKFIREDQKN